MVHWVTYHDHVGSHKGRSPATSNNERSRQNGRRSHNESAGLSSTDGGTFALRNSVPPLYPDPNQFPYQYRMYPRYNPKGMVEDIDIADLRYDHHRELFDIERGPRRDADDEPTPEHRTDCCKAESVAESGVSLVGCTETISGGSKETASSDDSPQSGGEGSSSSMEATRMPSQG